MSDIKVDSVTFPSRVHVNISDGNTISNKVSDEQLSRIVDVTYTKSQVDDKIKEINDTINSSSTSISSHIDTVDNNLKEFMKSPVNASTLQGLDFNDIANRLVKLDDMTIDPLIDWEATLKANNNVDPRTVQYDEKIISSRDYNFVFKTYWTDYDYLFINFYLQDSNRWAYPLTINTSILKYSLENSRRYTSWAIGANSMTFYPLNNVPRLSNIEQTKASTLNSLYTLSWFGVFTEIYGIKANRGESKEIHTDIPSLLVGSDYTVTIED